MTKGSIKLTLIAGTLLLAALTFAQGGGGARGGQGFGGGQGMRAGGSDTGLLSRPDVQKDLKMTEQQIKDVQAVQQAAMQAMRDAFQNGGGGGDREAMMKQFQEMQKKNDEKIMAILTADQKKRLKEIGVQTGGANVFFREDMQKELKMTDDQKKSLKDLQTKQGEANQSIFGQMRDQSMSREDGMAAIEKNNKILLDEVMKVLTAEQKTAYEGMKGAKFEGKIQNGNGGGRGGATGGGATGGGRGNGNGGGAGRGNGGGTGGSF